MEKKSCFIYCRNLMLSVSAGLLIGGASVVEAGIASKETPERVEMMFWSAVQNSTNPEELDAYVEEFPEGRFARLAKVRARALRRGVGTTSAPVVADPVAAEVVIPAPQVTEPVVAAAKAAPPTTPAAPPVLLADPIDSIATPEVEVVSIESKLGKSKEPVQELTLARQKPAVEASHDCVDCPEMVSLSAGRFTMGSTRKNDRADPPHEVELDYQFSISQYEITSAQWIYCVDQGGCEEIEGNRDNKSDRSPAVNISYRDAQDYVQWISAMSGNEYRLPTEAEWEYAARAGTSSNYWWGDQLKDSVANCRGCGGEWNDSLPADVDQFPANPFGLYAMSGGVSEWAQGCWTGSYKDKAGDVDSENCEQGVLRGGSWKNDADYLNSATRIKFETDVRYLTNGFRIVRVN